MQNKLTPCGVIARNHDPDRFFLSLLTEPKHQPALWALIAFHFEIARTREMVTDTTMGLIRLQWWKDGIKKFYETGIITNHEVMSELCAAIRKYNLPYDLFEAIIIAREFDVEDRVPTTIEGFYNYLDYTQTPFLKLINIIIGGAETIDNIKTIAQSYGAVGILRSFVFHARARRCYLPLDIIGTIEDVYAFKNQDTVKACAKIIGDSITHDIKKVNHTKKFFRGMKALTIIYAGQLEKNNYDVYSEKLLIPPAFKEWRVWWGAQ